MMPITRQELEILLDTPDRGDYVVSVYADLSVKDGFRNDVEFHLKNQARAAGDALREADARKALEENLDDVRLALRDLDPSAKGVAVFVSRARGLKHVVPLDFPVENRLILDEEPFVLPLLERWHGEPNFLIALVDSDEAHLFESYVGVVESVEDIARPDVDDEIQRDKPRFTYKKRFAQTRHERLHGSADDKFLQDVADRIADRHKAGTYAGLILLGQSSLTGPLRGLLPNGLGAEVVEEAPRAITARPEAVTDDVARVMERWHAERDAEILGELTEPWKETHLIANGPTDVLDALQQGRASRVIIGSTRHLPGSRCRDCQYRFGAPVRNCPYCQGVCGSINVVQEILRMALRHRTPIHLFGRDRPDDPLAKAGGVAAFLVAEANWAPDAATAQASQGH